MASSQSRDMDSSITTPTSSQHRWGFARNLSHNQYEEIVSWVECPTCKGSGKISKESEEEYIALIPLTDERLRPRRTLRYVGITFAICAIIVISLVIFLMPRSIVLSTNYPYLNPSRTVVKKVAISTYVVNMTLTNSVNLTSYNFFSISVTEIAMDIIVGDRHLNLHPPSAKLDVRVPIRGVRQLSMTGNLTLKSPPITLLSFCESKDYILRTIYMHFTFTVSSSYFGQTTQSTLRTTQGVNCHSTGNETHSTQFIA